MTITTTERKEEAWTVIHSYSRAEAIADGVLIPVDEKLAREAGFKVPVALTQAVYENYVRVPPGVHCQDETGRLWDILIMTRYAFQQDRCGDPVAMVELAVRNDNRAARRVKLKAQFGPGDSPSDIVLTIMLPEED